MRFSFTLLLLLIVFWQPLRLMAMAGSQVEAKSFILGWQFVSEARKNSFNISETQIVSVGSLLSYPSLSTVVIDVESRCQGVELSGSYAIDERYYLDVGWRLVNSEIAIPVGSGDNVYSSGRSFSEISVGINRLILPETPVTPAVRLGLYNEYAGYNLRRLKTVQPGEQVLVVDADFREITVMATFGISRHIGRRKVLEPYGIVGFGTRQISLFDNIIAQEIGGQKVLLNSVIGLNYCPNNTPERKIFVEYKIGATSGWSAGVKFKL